MGRQRDRGEAATQQAAKSRAHVGRWPAARRPVREIAARAFAAGPFVKVFARGRRPQARCVRQCRARISSTPAEPPARCPPVPPPLCLPRLLDARDYERAREGRQAAPCSAQVAHLVRGSRCAWASRLLPRAGCRRPRRLAAWWGQEDQPKNRERSLRRLALGGCTAVHCSSARVHRSCIGGRRPPRACNPAQYHAAAKGSAPYLVQPPPPSGENGGAGLLKALAATCAVQMGGGLPRSDGVQAQGMTLEVGARVSGALPVPAPPGAADRCSSSSR
eukprot:365408-Chlamydomonas_euryale.AAC.29